MSAYALPRAILRPGNLITYSILHLFNRLIVCFCDFDFVVAGATGKKNIIIKKIILIQKK